MTFATVDVVVTVDGDSPEGNVLAIPSGLQWPDTSGNPIVPDVVHATLVDGTTTITLTASDDFDPGVLLWDFILNFKGMPTINVPHCTVSTTNGGSQNIWTILSAAGWEPSPQ